MTNYAWAGIEPPSDDEMDELRIEIAATIDDHAEAHKKATRFHHLRLHRPSKTRQRTGVSDKMRQLRHKRHKIDHHDGAPPSAEQPVSHHAPVRFSMATTDCKDSNHAHHNEFAPQRFDSVEHCLSAIRDLTCYLDKSPRTIWLALEGIFTDRQSTTAPNLVRHRVSIFARTLPTAAVFLLVALILLHILLPEHAAGSGYTPVFSELGFLLILTLLTTVTFFVLAAIMLLMKSTLQERFLNGFSGLITWSIPIVLSFFMVSPDFLLLVQDITGSNSQNVAGIEDIFAQHDDIIETMYRTVVTYVSLYTGVLFAVLAFSKVFQEQRDYAHRHDVLRDVIPILIAQSRT